MAIGYLRVRNPPLSYREQSETSLQIQGGAMVPWFPQTAIFPIASNIVKTLSHGEDNEDPLMSRSGSP